MTARSRRRGRWAHVACWLLVAIGCTQMAGYILGNRTVRLMGFATAAAPLPTVFSTVDGVEGIATRHALHVTDEQGRVRVVPLDRATMDNFRPSYFLRNSYFLFLAYPHVLSDDLHTDGLVYLLCEGKLVEHVRIERPIGRPALVLTRTRYGTGETVVFDPECR